MTVPTLALQVHATGATQVAALATAVDQLRSNLASLAAESSANGLAGLQKMADDFKGTNLGGLAKEIRTMRQELTQALAGVRTDIVAGFDKMASQVKTGSAKVEGELKAAKAKVSVAAKKIDLGAGLTAGVSGKGLASASSVLKIANEITSSLPALQAATARENQMFEKRLWSIKLNTAKMTTAYGEQMAKDAADQEKRRTQLQINSAKMATAWGEALAKDQAAQDKRRIQLQVNSAKMATAFLEAQAKERAALEAAAAKESMDWSKYATRTMANLEKLRQARATALAKEEESKQSFIAKMMVGSAKIAETAEKAAVREAAAWNEYSFKVMSALANLRRAQAAAATVSQQEIFNRGVRAQVNQAMQNPIGNYSVSTGQNIGMLKELKAANDGVGSSTDKVAKKAREAAPHFKLLANQLNDAHSAARGLASGFGAMWLSWGNMLPLIAAASVAHTFKKAFDIGTEVSYQIKFMELLGQKTVEQSQIIREELREINESTKFTLVDLAQAMTVLGQAGKSPEESLKMVKPITDLATVGMVDMKTATELVLQVQALYNLSVEDTNKLVSQLYLTTKSGMINIENLGGSFKYASEANTRFGQSLEDSLVMLRSLGEARLIGSSGGTAFLNFLRDIAGRSGPAIKALEFLRQKTGHVIALYEKGPTGIERMRSVLDISRDIAEAMATLDKQSADRIANNLFSIRGGGRAFFADLRAQLKDTNSELNTFKKQLQEVDPLLARRDAEALISQTTEGQMKVLASVLSNVFDKVTLRFEKNFVDTLKNLVNVVRSSGFEQFVMSVFGTVQMLVQVVTYLATPLKYLLSIFLAYKAANIINTVLGMFLTNLVKVGTMAAIAGGGIKSLTGAISLQGVAAVSAAAKNAAYAVGMVEAQAAAVGTAAATRAAGGALGGLARVLGFLAGPIGGLITTIGIMGGAWLLTSRNVKTAEESMAEAIHVNGNLNVEMLEKEIRMIQLRNTLAGQKPNAYFALEEQIRSKQADELAKINEIREKERLVDFSPTAQNMQALNLARAQLGQITRETNTLIRHVSEARAKDEADAEAKAAADQLRVQAQMDKLNRQYGTGSTNFSADEYRDFMRGRGGAGAGGAGGRSGLFGSMERDNDRQTIEALARAEEGVLRDAFQRKQQLLEAHHKAGIVSEGAYQTQMIQMTEQYEARQISNLRDALSANLNEYNQNKAKLASIVTKKPEEADEKARRSRQLDNEFLRTKAQLEASVAKVEADASNRRALALATYQGEIKKVNDAQTDYVSKMEASLASEALLAQSKLALVDASEEVRAKAEAEAKVMAQGQDRLEDLYKGYRQAAAVYEEMYAAYGNLDEATNEERAALDAANAVLAAYISNIEQVNRLLPEWAAKSGEVAKATSLQTQFVNGAKNIASNLADAILEGGKDGGQKLKDWFKTTFFKQPIKVVLEGMLRPVGNFAQSLLMGGYSPAAGGAGAAAGAAGTGMNLISGVSSFIGMGANLGMGSFGAGLATGFNALGGGLSGIGGSLSAAGSIGGAGGLGMALGTLGPIVAGAALLYSVFGKKRGGPKHDGIFGSLGDMGVGTSANQELQGMARDSVKSMTDSFKSLAATLGGNAAGYQFGIGLSTDPEGTAPSMAQVRAYRNGTAFTESVDLNIGRSEEDLKNAVSNQVVEVLVRSLRDSGVKEEYLTYFESISAGLDAQGKMEALAGIAQIVKLTETLTSLGPQFRFLADQSLAAKVALAEMSGGFDALTANLNAYYENFYSDAEKRVISARNIATALSKAGMAFSESDILRVADMANAKEVFRDFVEAYIAMGEGGNKQTAALLSVAGAFNSIIPAAEDAGGSINDVASELQDLEQQWLTLTNNTVELRRREREALDASNRALYDRVQLLSDAKDTLQRAYDQELSNIDKQIDKHKELSTRYSDFAKSLEKFKADLTQGDLSPLTPEQKYTSARARMLELYQRAGTGDTEAMSQLTGAAQDFLQASRVYNASNTQYTSDFNLVQHGIDEGVVIARDAADYASQQVTLLEQQRNYIQSIVDPMLGIKSNTDTLVQAVVRIANMQTDPAISSYIAGQYQNLVGRAPTEVEQVTWNARAVMGATPTDLAVGIASSPDFRARVVGLLNAGDLWGAYNLAKSTGLTMPMLNQAAGLGAGTLEQWANANGMPIFHGGVDYVPRTGFALLQRGERVTSSSQRDRETDALLAELRELKELMREQIGAIYDSNDRNAEKIVTGTVEANRRLGFESGNAASARKLA